jgi:hypothetical protein
MRGGIRTVFLCCQNTTLNNDLHSPKLLHNRVLIGYQTLYSRAHLETLLITQIHNKFSAFHGTRMFITITTRTRQFHLSLWIISGHEFIKSLPYFVISNAPIQTYALIISSSLGAYSPAWALASLTTSCWLLCFWTTSFLRDEVVRPMPNHQPGGPGCLS